MKSKRKKIRYKAGWLDKYVAKPYKIVDEEAIKEIKSKFKKYGYVTSVMRYINKETLRMAYHSLTTMEDKYGNICKGKEKATGLDKMTFEEYGSNLSNNIDELLNRMRNHNYKTKLMLRTYIPKEKYKEVEGNIIVETKERPLSLASVEDKILQTAINNQVLVPITEEIFTAESFGYRQNKGVKEAIEYLEDIVYLNNTKYVLVLDNKAYFDSINRNNLIDMVKEIIKDKTFTAIIRIILETNYLDVKDKEIKETIRGTHQGLNISPVLANLYLHKVIDSWYKTIETEEEVFMVRYADDVVFLGKNLKDINKVYEEIKQRFSEYELVISEEKTSVINLEEDYLTFLGYKLIKKGNKVMKYLSEKKIISTRKEVQDIVKEAIDDQEERRVMIRNVFKHYRNYIRILNNKLYGKYRTYINSDDYIKLFDIYEYACDEVRRLWSDKVNESDLDLLIDHILPPWFLKYRNMESSGWYDLSNK